jgi:hypothetical protein
MTLLCTERITQRLQQLRDEVSNAGSQDYCDRLREFLRFCTHTPVLASCLANLPKRAFDFQRYPLHMLPGWIATDWPGGAEGYAMRWDALSKVADARSPLSSHFEEYTPSRTHRDHFTRLLLTPLYHYLLDQLNASGTMLYALLRYKRWAEWFEADRLREVYDDHGEDGLDRDMRRFLFESGIDYPYSEPRSPGGRADIVAGLETDDPLVLEIKVWDSNKCYREDRVRDGLRQAMDYAAKYGVDRGYIAVFNLDLAPLEFVSPSGASSWPARLESGSRTYYFIAVDIAEQLDPVSQRNKGKRVQVNAIPLSGLLDAV